MARTFKQLEKQKTEEGLRRIAKLVTEQYANMSNYYSQRKIAEENDLTVSCVRELMDYAIIRGVVSLKTADNVRKKSVENQKAKMKYAGYSSRKHHEELIRARNEYLIKLYPAEKARKLTVEFAYSPTKSIQYFTSRYGLESDFITRKIIERALEENLVPDEVLEKVIDRSLKGKRAEIYFNQLRKRREEH